MRKTEKRSDSLVVQSNSVNRDSLNRILSVEEFVLTSICCYRQSQNGEARVDKVGHLPTCPAQPTSTVPG